jgi:hypothetical protein
VALSRRIREEKREEKPIGRKNPSLGFSSLARRDSAASLSVFCPL